MIYVFGRSCNVTGVLNIICYIKEFTTFFKLVSRFSEPLSIIQRSSSTDWEKYLTASNIAKASAV